MTFWLASFSQVMNIKMTYLYRDGGNYKTWQEAVFTNRSGKSAEQLSHEIKPRLISGQFFDQSLAPIPFEYPAYNPKLDHTWLEFHSLKETSEQITTDQDIHDFIASLEANRA